MIAYGLELVGEELTAVINNTIMTNLKRYIDIIKEAEMGDDVPLRRDGREGTIDDLRKQIFGYIDDAHEAIDAGELERAHEYISYVYELVDDNI